VTEIYIFRMSSVEFALHPQHEAPFDSEKPPVEEASSEIVLDPSMVSLNCNDKEDVLGHQSHLKK